MVVIDSVLILTYGPKNAACYVICRTPDSTKGSLSSPPSQLHALFYF